MGIFFLYMYLISKMKDMKRLFSYHGAEHKTIRCYEAKLPLTVENVRRQTRLHPRCGTSFLFGGNGFVDPDFFHCFVFAPCSGPRAGTHAGGFLYRFIMIVYKLLLIPLVVSVAYEINRWVGRHDNAFARIITAPGMWFQNFTTQEPDDSMIEVGIAALEAVLPKKGG